MRTQRTAALLAGIGTLLGAVSPPVDRVAATKLSAHMLQHLVLLLVAAPLIVYGRPVLSAAAVVPRHLRRRLNRIVSKASVRRARHVLLHPACVWSVLAAALWAWHLPRLYELALANEIAHAAEHGSFLGAAFLFWGVVLRWSPRTGVGYGAVFALVFGTMLQSAWLAMILSFTPEVLYGAYGGRGTSIALADQHLAGVLMWVPMTVVLTVTMGVLFFRWLSRLDARLPHAVDPTMQVASGARR